MKRTKLTTARSLLLVGFVALLSLPLEAYSIDRKKPRKRKSARTTAVATTKSKKGISSNSADSTEMPTLYADGVKGVDKVKAKKNMCEIEDAREALEAPAIDLYGVDSWSSYVNPFAGKHSAEIPSSYEINCEGFVMPISGKLQVSSNYGYRARFGRNHRGVDLALHTGDSVRAAFSGKVRIRDYEGKGYGYYIVIRHPNGLETVYGHLSRQLVHRDQVVKAGDVIGLGGSTGRSTGPHLHLEFRFMGIPINPTQIVDFSLGVLQRDTYVFRRGSTDHAGPSYGELFTNNKEKATEYKQSANSRERAKEKAPQTHRIKEGDSLSSIAKRHGTTVAKLCKLNNMTAKATLRPGKSIRVR